jgi:hypothetical protein
MTKFSGHRGGVLAAGVAAAVSAGLATGALAAPGAAPHAATAPRIAVLATVGTPAPDIARATSAARARAGSPQAPATVVRAGGTLDAQSQAAALATGDFAVVAGVGDGGRAAVGQAASVQIGGDTAWLAVR